MIVVQRGPADPRPPITGTVVLIDEGAVLGSARALNFHGAGVTTTISGTYADIDIAGGGGPGGGGGIGVMGWDEGTPIGTGVVLNFIGPGVVASRSGTVIEVNVPGGAGFSPQTGTIVVADEGVVLGSARMLDVRGERATASISGTYVTILISPDPSEQIGIFGLDDGIPQGTGTSLDAGNFLALSFSGTRLRLDAVLPPEPQEQIGVMTWDEGMPIGTGTILNFIGAGVIASRSGTVVEVSVAGGGGPGGGGQIGLMGWDSGVPVGTGAILDARTGLSLSISGIVLTLDAELPLTGTFVVRDEAGVLGSASVIDFVGPGVSATISGSYARVSVPGPGADQIGIMAWDDGVPRGTGTVIDATSGLRLTLSGTVLDLKVETPVTGSIVVRDEAGVLGSAAVIDFAGPGVSATLSGSYARVSIPGPGVDQIGIMAWDDGVPRGTGTVLDATSGLRVTLSGTVLDLKVETPVTGTIVVRDEAGVLGSAAILDFVGPGVSTTLSGSYARVSVPGPGVDQIGIFGIEEGVPLGTGTSIETGYGLRMTISGTRLDLDVEAPVSGSIVLRDEAGVLGSAVILDFQGAGVTASLSGTYGQIVIPGGGGSPPPVTGTVVIRDEAGTLGSVAIINFEGAGVAATLSGTHITVAIPGGGATPTPITGSIVVRDEAAILGSAVVLDFKGAGVTASISGTYVQVSIPGGAGVGATGKALLDFGPFPGKVDTRALVNGQAGITTGSVVHAWLVAEDTVDHSLDEHIVEPLAVFAGAIAPGTGFVVFGISRMGQFNAQRGPMTDYQARFQAGGGERLYGRFNVGWSWA